MLMAITEYARHRGVGLRAVQFAVKRGRITRNPDGLIDSEQADREWQENTLHTNARLGPRKKKPEGADHHAAGHRAQQDSADPTGADRLAGASDFIKARTAREMYQARIAKLDYEERLANLVSRKSVEIEAHNSGRILRDACLNIPDRVSAQIAAETDPVAVYEILMAELRHVFEEFANRESPKEDAAA